MKNIVSDEEGKVIEDLVVILGEGGWILFYCWDFWEFCFLNKIKWCDGRYV